MPSIRVSTTPEVDEDLDIDVQLKLSTALREEVARIFEVELEHVEVLWLPTNLTVNATPIMIDVLYSVLPTFEPHEIRRIDLADRLGKITAGFEGMPDRVTEVAVWVLPQHDATFRVAKAE